MSTPPDKICEACGRAFSWRKRAARTWDQVRYCSRRCRSAGAYAPPESLILTIVETLAQPAPGRAWTVIALERALRPRGHTSTELRVALRGLVREARVLALDGPRKIAPERLQNATYLRLVRRSAKSAIHAG